MADKRVKKRKKKKKLKEKEELSELKGKYLRALADYQNLEKRIQKEKEKEAKFASRNIITKILPIVDLLEKIVKENKDEAIKIALNQVYALFEEENVERIHVMDKEYDPFIMNCVEIGKSKSDKDNIVIEEVRKGYKMHNEVIRVAQVKVGKS